MDNYNVRLRNALIKQHQAIFDYDSMKLRDEYCEYIDCPVCNSNKKSTAFTKDWFTFSKCSDCGMVYLNPRLNDSATHQFYNSEWNQIYNEQKFDTCTSSTLIDDNINFENLQIIKKVKPGKGKLLEVGIGKGYFLKQAQDAGYDVYGVELNKKNCEAAIRLLGRKDRVFNADILATDFEDDSFDVIYMKDVFEHVPNPIKILAEFKRIARKGCVLFIEVPNIEGLIFKIAKEQHVCIFAFEHLNYWSPQTLTKALNSEGFVVHHVDHESMDFTPVHILGYFLESAFTSVEERKSTGLRRFILKAIRKVCTMPPLSYLDVLFPRIANFARRGSQIKVLAIKP